MGCANSLSQVQGPKKKRRIHRFIANASSASSNDSDSSNSTTSPKKKGTLCKYEEAISLEAYRDLLIKEGALISPEGSQTSDGDQSPRSKQNDNNSPPVLETLEEQLDEARRISVVTRSSGTNTPDLPSPTSCLKRKLELPLAMGMGSSRSSNQGEDEESWTWSYSQQPVHGMGSSRPSIDFVTTQLPGSPELSCTSEDGTTTTPLLSVSPARKRAKELLSAGSNPESPVRSHPMNFLSAPATPTNGDAMPSSLTLPEFHEASPESSTSEAHSSLRSRSLTPPLSPGRSPIVSPDGRNGLSFSNTCKRMYAQASIKKVGFSDKILYDTTSARNYQTEQIFW